MNRIRIDDLSKFLFFSILLSTLLLSNGFYLFFSISTIFIILYSLQQPFKPGVFSVIAVQHFLQIFSGVLLCNYIGKDIDFNTQSRSVATIASCVGMFFLLGPVYYVQSKQPNQTFQSLRKYTATFSTNKIYYAYITSFFIAAFLNVIASSLGGLTQIVYSIVKIKWLLFLLAGYQALLKNEKKNIFYLFVVFEFISGFFSFFSEFKTVIFFVIVLAVSLFGALNFKEVFYVILIGLGLGAFGLVWTNVKTEYRAYINEGSKDQVVAVEKGAALNKLYDLSSGVQNSKLDETTIQLLDRIQYTYHFAKTIDRVPEIIPFQKGDNWLGSLEFTTTPRFLNPDKPSYEATEKTKKYTGIRYAGRQQGTSFSLGYFADCYIDFGLYGMMFILLALGCLYAFFYKYLLTKSSDNVVFNYSVTGAFFLEFYAFEMDSTFLLGRLFSSMLTFFFLVKFFFPFLIRYISITVQKENTSVALEAKL